MSLLTRVGSLAGRARTTANLEYDRGAPSAPSAELVVLMTPGQDGLSQCRAPRDEPLLIGRDVPAAHLRVEDAGMSRLHARCIDRGAEGVQLIDCQSRNGTYVNGRRVQSALLSAGDIVRVGDTLLTYSSSEPMQRAHELVRLTAASGLSALLRGETGTGKELLAREIHQRSGRSGKFVALNCASLPKELILAELFGHAKGAFSGALQRRTGLFLAAQGGTLLLDEIGDCCPAVQAALLRVLQERTIRPLGEEREIAIDVQVVAATHRNLEESIRAGSFRADLYARLAQAVITLPPLRERRHQILPLLRGVAQESGCAISLTTDAAEALLLWDYAFNIRELQSIARLFAVSHAPCGQLSLGDLERDHGQLVQHFRACRGDSAGPATPQVCEGASPSTQRREQLKALLTEHQGNVSKIAAALGKPRAQVYRWLGAYGLSAERFREQADAASDGQAPARRDRG
jgi:transcriptional regulator with GAF, ATPase, and Fis domain